MNKNGHNHVEAFCVMQYAGKNNTGHIILNIWNSRDGVTPFCMLSNEFGIELQHINWKADVYLPNYLPKKGDLIWTSYTKEEAEEAGRKRFASMKKKLAESTDSNMKGILEAGIERGEDYWVEYGVKELFNLQQPKLVLVKEDWKPKTSAITPTTESA